MAWPRITAPECLDRCSGAVLFSLLLLVLFGCEGARVEEEPATLELTGGTIRLPPGSSVADVLLRREMTGRAVVEPETVRVRPGDVVRFISGDSYPHAPAFDAGRLTPESMAFLRASGQLEGPPLVSEGATWIIDFADAPPGGYPFVDVSQGIGGIILVVPPAAPDRR